MSLMKRVKVEHSPHSIYDTAHAVLSRMPGGATFGGRQWPSSGYRIGAPPSKTRHTGFFADRRRQDGKQEEGEPSCKRRTPRYRFRAEAPARLRVLTDDELAASVGGDGNSGSDAWYPPRDPP